MELDLEHGFVKAPYELLSRAVRTEHRVVEKAAAGALNSVSAAVQSGAFARAATVAALQSAREKLETILNQTGSEKEAGRLSDLILTRINYLQSSTEATQRFEDTRVDRFIVDFLLREGYAETAADVAKSLEIEPWVDLEVHEHTKEITDALRGHNLAPALRWCNENKSKLKKLGSRFEFALRRQEMVELVRQNKQAEALQHAQEHLLPVFKECSGSEKPEDQQCVTEVHRCLGLAAFEASTPLERYKYLLEEARWEDLIREFRIEHYRMFSLPPTSFLDLALQAGISALKTRTVSEKNSLQRSPFLTEEFETLSRNLPYSSQSQSSIVCRILGKVMDDVNPPMALPNGQVYSQQGLMTIVSNGQVKCPVTGETFPYERATKVFVL